jgi:acyl-coenzyme A thioesterase PaaI-like protein
MAAAPVVSTAVDTTTALRNPPTDEETLSMFTPYDASVKEIEDRIWNHPITQRLRSDARFTASRPHLKIPPTMRNQNFMAGILQGPDLIVVPPLQFTTQDGSDFVSFQYLGTALCGHPGIVHGGLIGTLLDEGCGRCCFPALPNRIAVTASLKIDYRKPLMAGQIVVLRAQTVKAEGRKAWVKARLESLPQGEGAEGKVQVFAEAEALFIEPKGAKNMLSVPV